MSDSKKPQNVSLTAQEVDHVARLARLELNDEERELYRAQLSSIVSHAQDIASLDIDDVPPTAHSIALINVFREDTIRESLRVEEALANAPSVELNRFRVPKVLGDAP